MRTTLIAVTAALLKLGCGLDSTTPTAPTFSE